MSRRPTLPGWVAALSALCGPALLTGQQPGPVTAFTGVTVVTMVDSLLRSGMTVVVRDDRIEALAPDGEVRIPEEAAVISGRGAYVLPGLVDAHVHLEWAPDTTELLLYVANGVTTVRSMDGRLHLLEWAEDIAAGRTLGPRIVSAGMVIDGRDRGYDETAVAASPAEGRRIVGEQAAQGFRFVKVYNNLAPDTYHAIADEARRRGMPVVGHVPDSVSIMDAVEAGQRSIEHFDGFAPVIAADSADAAKMAFLAMRVDSVAVERLAERLAARDVYVVPTFSAFDRAAPADRARDWFDRPEHAYLHPQLTEGWAYLYYNYAFRSPAFFAAMDDGKRSRALVARILHRKGVPLAVGTDAPLLSVEPGFAIHRELAHFVEAGLEPFEALRGATVTAAELLGMEHAIGTIAVGKRGDLVLVADNPLEDLSTLRQPLGVMAGGRWIPRAELDLRLETLARSFGQPKNTFADAPDTMSGSQNVHRYIYEFRGRPLGRERASRDSAGVTAQVVTDNPEETWYDLRWDLGDRHRGRRLELTSWSQGPRTHVSIQREGGRVAISVHAAGERADTALQLPAQGVLLGPGLAGLAPTTAAAMDLGVAESTTLPFAGVWVEDGPTIVQGSVTVERRADSGGLRSFALTFAVEGGREQESRLMLDPAGEPITWTWDHPLGEFGYVRDQREP